MVKIGVTNNMDEHWLLLCAGLADKIDILLIKADHFWRYNHFQRCVDLLKEARTYSKAHADYKLGTIKEMFTNLHGKGYGVKLRDTI